MRIMDACKTIPQYLKQAKHLELQSVYMDNSAALSGAELE